MNFCAPQLLPEISTNKPSADGYEVSNLVNEDSLCHSRGFMGEYFLKPPLDIILHFPVPIDISHVLLGTQLRNQCSIGFSLLTQSSTSNTSSRNDSTISAIPEKNCLLKRKRNDSDVNTTEVIRQAHGTGIYECGSLVPLQEYEDENDRQENDVSSGRDIFLSVGYFYTDGEETVLLSNSLYRHWFDVPRPKIETILSGISSVYTNNMRPTNRYIANESQWGRPASDPFSGLPFKEGRGPIPNIALKARIDRYILLNGNHRELQNIGHSLHSSTGGQQHTESASTSGSINYLSSNMGGNGSDGDGTYKRKHSQLETRKVTEIEESNSKISNAAPKSCYSAHHNDKIENNDRINIMNQEKNVKESDELSQNSINSCSSWSTFNSSQLTNISQKSSCEVKRYLHPINTDRISKTSATIDASVPDFGRSRLQMLNQVASMTRSSSTSKVSRLIRPSTSNRGQPILLQNDSTSKTHNIGDLIKRPLDKSKPSSLICGDIKKDKFDLDLVLSSKGAACLCGEMDNLYNLNCNHILCRACVLKTSDGNKIKCPDCDIESQNSEISKHNKKSVFL